MGKKSRHHTNSKRWGGYKKTSEKQGRGERSGVVQVQNAVKDGKRSTSGQGGQGTALKEGPLQGSKARKNDAQLTQVKERDVMKQTDLQNRVKWGGTRRGEEGRAKKQEHRKKKIEKGENSKGSLKKNIQGACMESRGIRLGVWWTSAKRQMSHRKKQGKDVGGTLKHSQPPKKPLGGETEWKSDLQVG